VDAAHLELLCQHFWTAEKMLGGVAVMAAVGVAVVVPLLLQVRVVFHSSVHQSHVRACVCGWVGVSYSRRFISAHPAPPVT
jgi:hypothetical protein